MLHHGGGLIDAAKQFGIPAEDWIDLSTGINPFQYPVTEIPSECFSRLPEDNDGLVEAAQKYYQAELLLPVAGSQAAIQLLPLLREKSKVAVPSIGYAEHAYQWKKAGHDVISYSVSDIEHILNDVDVLIIINPNNPTGELFSQNQIMQWHKHMQSRNGWVIVDEAFIDCENMNSLAGLCNQPGLIVLRSVGKFFGLAGLRGGFIFAEDRLLNALKEKLGPWTLSGVSRYVIKRALLDTKWQQETILRLTELSAQFDNILIRVTGTKPEGTYLFKTIFLSNAEYIYKHLAEQGVLVRLLDNQQGMRFGLPMISQMNIIAEVFELVFLDLNQSIHTKKKIPA